MRTPAAGPCPPTIGAQIRWLAITAALVALLQTAPAHAATQQALQAREHRQTATLHRWRGTVRFFANHPRQARTHAGRVALHRAHIWVRVVIRELAETRAQLQPRSPWPAWWEAQALCIHSHEGAWNDATGNGYWGGMQFLLSTWQSVGGRGLPSQASPHEQLFRAWLVWQRDRGWSEWGTRGLCGV